MKHRAGKKHIIIGATNDDDRQRLEEAARLESPEADICCFTDGREVLHYLFGETPTGEAAVRQCDSVDLVLIEAWSGAIPGISVLRTIKNSESCHRTPVVLFSTLPSAAELDTAYEAGCNAYVTFTPEGDRFIEDAHILMTYWLAINESSVEFMAPASVESPARKTA